MGERTGRSKERGGRAGRSLSAHCQIGRRIPVRISMSFLLRYFFRAFFPFMAGLSSTGTSQQVFKVMNVTIDRPTACTLEREGSDRRILIVCRQTLEVVVGKARAKLNGLVRWSWTWASQPDLRQRSITLRLMAFFIVCTFTREVPIRPGGNSLLFLSSCWDQAMRIATGFAVL